MIGGDEVRSDEQQEGKQAASFGLVFVGTALSEQWAHVLKPPVVDPAQSLRDRLFAAGPVADGVVHLGKIDANRPLAGGSEREQVAQLDKPLTTDGFDALDHIVHAHLLPPVQDRVEQGLTVVEVPVEAAFGNTKGASQRLDPDSVRTALGKGE